MRGDKRLTYSHELYCFIENILNDIIDPLFWVIFSHAFNCTFTNEHEIDLITPNFLNIQPIPQFRAINFRTIVLSTEFWNNCT